MRTYPVACIPRLARGIAWRMLHTKLSLARPARKTSRGRLAEQICSLQKLHYRGQGSTETGRGWGENS
ncbi:unnamed protein product [Colias eurytheme]|nr:unnamed protein product [Colias eurytheme]